MSLSRRQFGFAALTTVAFSGMSRWAQAYEDAPYVNEITGYGPLRTDAGGLLDLPEGFSYSVVSRAGDVMDDGFHAPGNFDGMGCFAAGPGKIALVRNHELTFSEAGWSRSAARETAALQSRLAAMPHFGRAADGRVAPGGTSTLIVDMATGRRESEFLSITGTSVNCAGGATPWGSWLTCEEAVNVAPESTQSHGWVFEVPSAQKGLVTPQPIKGMGRYRHEAAAVDPKTGIVYLTEDRDNSLFYRYLPDAPGELVKGGRLQALAFANTDIETDSRNWYGKDFAPGSSRAVRWIDMREVESPNDDLRVRGHARGAVQFARGEGLHLAVKPDGSCEFYFTCTSGGPARLGQIMRYVPSPNEGRKEEADQPARLQLFVESTDPRVFEYGDNLTVTPQGHLVVCEDKTGTKVNYLRGIAPSGKIYALARLTMDTELAGACFSPDGQVLFVNAYHPGITLAIRGPWSQVRV
ncbi:MAG TPA: alkaline phosphatase PhoX [Rhizomicrobium sp.]|nr:alkaline phosphatase PhoX [Rhizomicrobium sp.]